MCVSLCDQNRDRASLARGTERLCYSTTEGVVSKTACLARRGVRIKSRTVFVSAVRVLQGRWGCTGNHITGQWTASRRSAAAAPSSGPRTFGGPEQRINYTSARTAAHTQRNKTTQQHQTTPIDTPCLHEVLVVFAFDVVVVRPLQQVALASVRQRRLTAATART